MYGDGFDFHVRASSVGWKGGSIESWGALMKRVMLLLLLCILPGLGPGAGDHRPAASQAEQLLPQFAPFVEPGGAITGMNDKLFLRASAAQPGRDPRPDRGARHAPAAADDQRAPGRQPTAAAERGAGASGRVEVGAGGTAISGRGHLYQSDSRSRRDVAQQVQTIDGGRAAIMVGQIDGAALAATGDPDPLGAVVSESLVQRDLGTGFVAVPRLNGDRVTLEISPRDDTPGPLPGSVNTQRLVTTVSGRLGEWLELGGSGTEQSASGSGIIRYSTQSASRQRRLLLRIEALD
jgi:hypothetical protein